MRYRPLGPTGMVVSAVSLLLQADPTRPRARDWAGVINAALESGINTFEVVDSDPYVMDGLALALAGLDRRLVFLSWRLGPVHATGGRRRDFNPDSLVRQAQAALARTGINRLDAVILDDPSPKDLTPEVFAAVRGLKQQGMADFIGVSGIDADLDGQLAAEGFNLLAAPFNLISGWAERNRLRAATDRDVAVFGRNPYPRDFHQSVLAAAGQAPRVRHRAEPLAGIGSYGFLDGTRGWTAEEICIAYALTEPSLATVQIPAPSLDRLDAIAQVPEREMPPGLAAQIEMARFTPPPAADGRRTA